MANSKKLGSGAKAQFRVFYFYEITEYFYAMFSLLMSSRVSFALF